MSETVVTERITLAAKVARDERLTVLEEIATNLRNMGPDTDLWENDELFSQCYSIWTKLEEVGLLPGLVDGEEESE